MLKFTLLGFLNYAPMSGYELKQHIDSSTSHFWHAKLSQIYTTLKSLEGDSCVVSEIYEQQERPDRRVYSITPKGEQLFKGWLAEPYLELSPKKETLILKMFFSAQLNPQTTLAQLKMQLEIHKKQLAYYRHEALENILAASNRFQSLEQDAKMWEAARRFGEMYEEVYVRWIEEMISETGKILPQK